MLSVWFRSAGSAKHILLLIMVHVVDKGTMPCQFSNLHAVLVRDCLLTDDVDTLGSACLLLPWCVAKEDLRLWFDL